MIKRSELVPVGEIGKPHGLSGEMQVMVDADVPVSAGDCLVVPIDGIFIPFFVDSARRRSSSSWLIKFADIDTDRDAAALNGLGVYMTIEHIDSLECHDNDEDDGTEGGGFYLGSLIGVTAVNAQGEIIGEIVDINDATANILFEVERPDGSEVFIPVTEDFIAGFDHDSSVLTLDLPQGLLDVQT